MNSSVLLTGNSSQTSSFFAYIYEYIYAIYISMSLGKTTTVVLQGYLYTRVTLVSLCGLTFFFLGVRAAIILDYCSLFPKCMLALIPFREVVLVDSLRMLPLR